MPPRDHSQSGRIVVCAFEGTRNVVNTVEVARQLALVTRAQLALVAVASVEGATEGREPGLWTPEQARRALELTADALHDTIAVAPYLELGDPVRRLVEFATNARALLLVVGTSAGAGRLPSGVAGELARRAPCPVVIVPETAAVPALVGSTRT